MTRLITTLSLVLTFATPSFAAGKSSDTGREVSSVQKSEETNRDAGTTTYAPAKEEETKKARRPLPHRQGSLEDRSRP